MFVEHALTRSVTDAALILDITGRPDRTDNSRDGEGTFLGAASAPGRDLRIGVCTQFPTGDTLHPTSQAALSQVARCLGDLGYQVRNSDPAFDVHGGEEAFLVLFSKSLANRISWWTKELERRPEETELEPYTRVLYEMGLQSSDTDLVQAEHRLQTMTSEFLSLFDDVDIWLTPTLGVPSFEPSFFSADLPTEELIEHDGLVTAFTWPANVTGSPAISIPVFHAQDSQPLGIQLTGRPGDERSILSVAGDLERAELVRGAGPQPS